jgi:Asp-tRNA(Asn)/Glu-tRNA(Gln) amidotransferase C subunit
MMASAETVGALAAAAGLSLSEERCAELVPLFEAALAAAKRLRSLDLTGYEPAGPAEATNAPTGG